MKTDEEMIESLFRRRDEYYRKEAGKHTFFAALKITGGIALPIAAAGAVTLLLISAQKNFVTDDIGSDITDIPKTEPIAADTYNGAYFEEPGENKKISLESAPLCFSFGDTVYRYESQFLPAEADGYAKKNLIESGTGIILETDAENPRCTVYGMRDTEQKALIVDGKVCLYKPVFSSSYTIEGIEFRINALHRTAKKYRASMLPIFKENEDVIFRAYDIYGKAVNDVFILYTPALTAVADNALWEVTAEYSYKPDYTSSINLINYYDLTALCDIIRSDRLSAADIIHEFGHNAEIFIDNTLETAGVQLYYTDLHRTEYVLAAYDHSDEIALTRIATGEMIYITDPESDYRAFLDPENASANVKDEYEDTADKVSRLFDMYLGNTLTTKELEEVGFTVSEIYPDRYVMFFAENGTERVAAVFMENGDEVRFVPDGYTCYNILEPIQFIVVDIDTYYESYCD